MPVSDDFGTYLNRRNQDEAGRRRNIEDGLRGEKALAQELVNYGIGFCYPQKYGPEPDITDFIVEGKYWSVKTSRMRIPVVCAAQSNQPADRYVFYGIADDECYCLGTLEHDAFYDVARYVAKDEPITNRFTAHYGLYVCDVDQLEPLYSLLERIVRGERG